MDTGTPNKIVGMLHGILFIVYIVFIIFLAINQRWKKRKLAFGLLASIIPFGTFYFVAKWMKSSQAA